MNRFKTSDFERLALPLLDSLFNFACWLTGDPDEAQDLVQETFIKALRAYGVFQEGRDFRVWMFRILHTSFLTSKIGLARRDPTQDDDYSDEESVVSHAIPEITLWCRKDIELMPKAIAQLQPSLQEALLLADVEEMKYEQVAEILNIPIGTVALLLERARKKGAAMHLAGSRCEVIVGHNMDWSGSRWLETASMTLQPWLRLTSESGSARVLT